MDNSEIEKSVLEKVGGMEYKGHNWFTIIVFIIILQPLGIYFLAKRIIEDKKMMEKTGSTERLKKDVIILKRISAISCVIAVLVTVPLSIVHDAIPRNTAILIIAGVLLAGYFLYQARRVGKMIENHAGDDNMETENNC